MHTDAIILHTQPWRESDLQVRCYTEQSGMLTGVARGALRPGSVQAMHLDQGNLVRFQLIPGKGMPIVTGAQARESFAPDRSGIRRRLAVFSLLEAVSSLVTGTERDDRLWRALTGHLAALAVCGDDRVLPELRSAQREVLDVLGYAPRMRSCGICGTSVNGGSIFSVQMGCAVCGACAGSGWGGTAMDEAGRLWMAGGVSDPHFVSAPSRAPTELLMEYIAGRPLRSLGLLFRAYRA